MEVFKEIEGFEGLYAISNTGKVKSLKRYNHNPNYVEERILKTVIKRNGYVKVGLYKDNKKYYFTIHRLVAKAFIPNPENKPEVNHIDGNKQNNCVDNLEWVTSSENQKHAFKIGLQKPVNNCKYLLEHVEKSKIKVCQFDLNNNYIQTFGSIEDANRYLKEKYNICGHVWDCIAGRRKTTGGFKWKKGGDLNVGTK